MPLNLSKRRCADENRGCGSHVISGLDFAARAPLCWMPRGRNRDSLLTFYTIPPSTATIPHFSPQSGKSSASTEGLLGTFSQIIPITIDHDDTHSTSNIPHCHPPHSSRDQTISIRRLATDPSRRFISPVQRCRVNKIIRDRSVVAAQCKR